jgi:hypothetical protein
MKNLLILPVELFEKNNEKGGAGGKSGNKN